MGLSSILREALTEGNKIWEQEIEDIRLAFVKKFLGENLPENFGKNLKNPICVLLGTNHEDGRIEAANNLAVLVNLVGKADNATAEEIRFFIEEEAKKTTYAVIGLDIREAHRIVEARWTKSAPKP